MQERTINLTFHGIGAADRRLDAGEADVWVSRERFDAILDAVADRQTYESRSTTATRPTSRMRFRRCASAA